MPIVNVEYSDEDSVKLQEEYIKMSIVWPQLGNKDLPPSLETWVGARAVEGDGTSISLEVDDLHVFNVLEKLIAGLEPHGFGLAHLSREEGAAEEGILAIANALVSELKLQPKYIDRIQQLLSKNVKSPKELADAAQVGITHRAQGALHATYQKLLERSAKAADHLGEDRAIGRVEGAGAILAGINIIDRNSAEEKTTAFRQQLKASHKKNWVGKVFGRSAAPDASKKE